MPSEQFKQQMSAPGCFLTVVKSEFVAGFGMHCIQSIICFLLFCLKNNNIASLETERPWIEPRFVSCLQILNCFFFPSTLKCLRRGCNQLWWSWVYLFSTFRLFRTLSVHHVHTKRFTIGVNVQCNCVGRPPVLNWSLCRWNLDEREAQMSFPPHHSDLFKI